MKLVTRLTVGFLGVVLLVISLHEYRRLRQELGDFEEQMDRSHLLVATTLADAVELVAPREGVEAALRTVEATGAHHKGDLRIRWVCLNGHSDLPPAPIPCEALAAVEVSRSTVELDPDGSPRRFTLAPIRPAGVFSGAIEVSDNPKREGTWATQHFNAALLLAFMTVTATTAAAFVLGWWMVARPTRALVEKARSVGRGELDPPLHLPNTHELGDLAQEMNAMCDHLREARDATAREGAARLAAVEQLRHSDRLATVGRLASGLAHELGTPLNIIEARADLILGDTATEDPVRGSANVIIECAEQMTLLIQQLLDFARQRPLQKAPLRLDALAQRVVELVRPLAAKRDVALETDTPAIAPVLADEVLLQQAVTNLLINAVHACRAGGRVSIGARERRVPRPGEEASRSWCALEVRDNGEGMASDVQARIFEPFYTTKSPGEGTGLGLPVAWGIVEDHGGWIAVDSTPGQGSTFTIHLPGGAG